MNLARRSVPKEGTTLRTTRGSESTPGLLRWALVILISLCFAVNIPAQETTDLRSDWSLSPDQQEAVSSRDYPDSFTIMSVSGEPEEPGRLYRVETWHYHGERLAFLFVDGEQKDIKALDWTDARPGPTTRFRPVDFAIGMTVRKVEANVLGPDFETGLGIPEDSPEYEGASQGALQLGFENGLLVYVDTSPDRPDDE